MGANLSLVPRPPAPWTIMEGPNRGQPTTEFYRFIASLLNVAGGNTPATLEQLEVLLFAQTVPSSAVVDTLGGQVAAVQAMIATLPKPPPDLTQAVQTLAALIALIPSPGPDLTHRVEALEALVFTQRLTA